MKYSDIIKLNNQLSTSIDGSKYKIVILSNTTINQSKEICEYSLREESINAEVFIGKYDNIVQDSSEIKDADAVLIFWEVCNFIDGFHYKINSLSEHNYQNILKKVKLEIDLVFKNLRNIPLVLINEFSTVIFEHFSISKNRASQITEELNTYLEGAIGLNTKIISINKVLSRLSIAESVDLRYFYSSKALYNINFYKDYFKYIKPFFLAANGRVKKALIFDCDNTLWKGVLGEDGFENIIIYKEVQHLALELSKQGIIIGLCSKNNPEDIDDVINNHPDMILREANIVIKKVNWDDKVSNLKSIASELNISTESIVFIDDSRFEIELVASELPEITVFHAPKREYEYGLLMRELLNLFFNFSKTQEDLQKTKIFKEQLNRTEARKKIGNIDDYLASLDMVLTVYIDNKKYISRISQMTQKTNQFNLTTKRYTENEIALMIDNKSINVIAINVHDKYGDSGLTGLAILDNTKAEIDTFLLSCRVIGRNIEYQLMNIIIDKAKKNKLKELNSSYIRTNKNQQVADFYPKLSFVEKDVSETKSKYNIKINEYNNKKISYIEVRNGK